MKISLHAKFSSGQVFFLLPMITIWEQNTSLVFTLDQNRQSWSWKISSNPSDWMKDNWAIFSRLQLLLLGQCQQLLWNWFALGRHKAPDNIAKLLNWGSIGSLFLLLSEMYFSVLSATIIYAGFGSQTFSWTLTGTIWVMSTYFQSSFDWKYLSWLSFL